MKISKRFSNGCLSFCFIFALFLIPFQSVRSQSVSQTDGTANCNDCTAINWTISNGTPDISNATIAAAAGVQGGGANWVVSPTNLSLLTLPAPPNGHTSWLSLKDIGNNANEEAVDTDLTGLTPGYTYEVIVYILTAVTDEGDNSRKYSGTYNDTFKYMVSGSPPTSLGPVRLNNWGSAQLRFTAASNSEILTLLGGSNSDANGASPASFELYESVQISVTQDAINTVPFANDDFANTAGTTPIVFNVVANDVDVDGSINPSTVDLNTSASGIQTSITTADGTWSVNASGDVTFTAFPGFLGNATLTYTVDDTYVLDGIDQAATSNNGTITVTVTEEPFIEVVKTYTINDNGDGEIGLNDVVVYSINVTNIGNVTLNSVSVIDALEDLNGNPLSLTTGPNFSSADQGSPAGTLVAGETATYVATYLIAQGAIDAGGLSNSVTASGTGIVGGSVNDISDDGDDTDGNTEDDPTITIIPENPSLDATKTFTVSDNGDGVLGVDDVITYTIRIRNTGNVTITGFGIVDTLEDFFGNSRSLTTGPTFISSTLGSPIGTVRVGETVRYTATYAIVQEDVDAGGLRNSVLASGNTPSGAPVSDISDDADDTDGNTEDDPTETPIAQNPAIEVTKTFFLTDNGDGVTGINDVITYSITVENVGNVNLTNVSIVDSIEDLLGNPMSLTTGPTFVESDQFSPEGELLVGETATYTATYSLTQNDVNAGGISNSVEGSAESPAGDPATDISDDGDDTDGNTEDDPTITIIDQNPSLEATKTFSFTDNGDGMMGVDDVITYSIRVRNNGNVDLTNVSLTDTLLDAQGNPLSLTNGPTFVSANLGSAEGTLLVGEIATYTATYVLSQAAVDAGGVSNSVFVEAEGPLGDNVTDTSDDGDDTDGNTVDDPTETLIPENSTIEATKIATLTDNGDGVIGVDDVVSYAITIENTGNVTINNISIEDILEDFDGNSLGLTTGPIFIGSDQGSPEGTLRSGESASYTATYVLEQSDVNSGGIRNSINVTGQTPSDNDVTDISDDGDDTDGNTEDDPTETIIPPDPILEATKIANVSDNGDGVRGTDDIISYSILIRNAGNVDLTNINLVDTLEDFLGNSKNLTTGPTFVSANLGSPEGTLLVGETATYTATYAIKQSDADAGGVRNSILVSGDSPDGDNVTDVSDDGDDTDGNTVDDPTETIIPENPVLEATKVASVVDDDGDGQIGVNDIINYSITVRNTGNVILTNVSITDVLTDLLGNSRTLNTGPTFVAASQGSPEGTIRPREVATYTATYVITQADVDAGGVSNTVNTEGESPVGTVVTDTSDDGDDTDGNTVDDPTETLIQEDPSIEATKTASITDDGDGFLGSGDTINYEIRIQNTGINTLTNIGVVDTLNDLLGNGISLTTGPTFSSSSLGSAEGTLQPGEIAIYTATYIITDSDVAAGGVSNSVLVDGDTAQGTNVTDTSDDGDDTDGNTVDDPTVTIIPSMEITKTFTITDNGDGVTNNGDTINYTITIENTGTEPLSNVSIVDTLTDLLGNSRSLTTGPTFVSASQGSVEGSLLPGEVATYTASYVIVVDDVVAGGLSNTVVGTASSPDGNLTDTSDDGDDTDGNTEDDPTITIIVEAPSIEATKTASITDNGDNVLGVDDVITYTITIENTGNIPLTNIDITDTLTDLLGNSLNLTSGPTFVDTNLLGIEGTLVPGEIATYTATYIITQDDVNAGGVRNSVIATGETPIGTNTTDTSDDGDDTDGNTVDDPTETLIPETPMLEATKTASITDDGDGILGINDLVTYTITVQNTGNVDLTNINVIDTLLDLQGGSLSLTSGPDFVSSDAGSPEGALVVGETATYTATYIITQNDVDAGGLSNSVEVSGDSPTGTNVTDTSDDGDDTDGNTEDDPTVTPITENPSIETTKTAVVTDNGDGVVGAGDTITYTITIENTGDVTLNNVSLTDQLSDFLGNALTLTSGPDFDSADLGSVEGTLLVGETATYTATYIITQSDVDAGGVSNVAIGSADSPSGDNVTDTSDDGDDTDGNTTDDPTETPTDQNPSIEATKTYTITDNGDGILGAGDTINYTITVQNTGSITLSNIDLADTLTDFGGNNLTLTSGPTFDNSDQGSPEGTLLVGETATYTATYVITQSDVDLGGVNNTVVVSADSPSGSNITDTSDDGDDTDGNTEDDPTVTPIPEVVSLEATKTYTITNNGNDTLGAGDVINYTITVENTGNITVTNVSLVDNLSDFLGTVLNLSSGPDFDSSSLGSSEGTLLPGEIATYTATYVITQSDVDAGGVSNSAIASGESPNGTNVTDTSDDGDDTDGNTVDDPTETPIQISLGLEATKTAVVTDNGDGFNGVGDIITYTITLENTGNVDLFSISITDTLTDLLGTPLTLDSGPTFESSTLGSPEGTILIGEIATYTATYTITQADVNAGGVSNSVVAEGVDADGTNVTDTSDDGDDTDGNTEDDPTETLTNSFFDLSVTKEVDNANPSVGENVTFTITVSNDGLVDAANVEITDVLPSGYIFVSATTTAGTYTNATGIWAIDLLMPGDLEILEITAEVLGFGEYLNTVTITNSDRGTDDDPSNDTDEATVVPNCLIIYNEFSPNGDGVNDNFEIDCIESFPNSKLEVYNRWGNLVFETVGYQNDWQGTSNGRAVINGDKQLPVGTYYYVIDLRNGTEPLVGWLYINR